MLIFLILQTEKSIIVEGVSSTNNVSLDVARDRAISDALRNAVEQALGTYIESQTIIENYNLIEDNILSKSKGYVKNYKIISEKQEDGLYRVKIIAIVDNKKIEDDLSSLKILILQKERPRILILANEEFLEDILIEKFRDKEFPIVDQNKLKEKLKKEEIRLILEGAKDSLLARYALREGAEIILIAKYNENKKKVEGYNIDLKEVSISARLIDPRSAEVLASTRIDKSYPNITQTIKNQLVDSLFSVLLPKTIKQFQENNIVKIYVYNVSFDDVGKLREVLINNVRKVDKIILREFLENNAILELITPENPTSIAQIIKSNFKNVEISEIGGMNIYVRWKGK
ncbi:MAG: flagellar assembly protein T N-terminal domain-containing protein [candidate division WOR-3 bacterium]|jgi:hypothetical protein